LFDDVNVMIVLDTQSLGNIVLYYCNMDYWVVLLSIEGIILMILMLVLSSCAMTAEKINVSVEVLLTQHTQASAFPAI